MKHAARAGQRVGCGNVYMIGSGSWRPICTPWVPGQADDGDGVVMHPDWGPNQGPVDIRLPGLMSHASRFGEQVYPATAGARSSTCHRMWAFSAFLGPRPHMGSNPHMWMSPHVTSLVSRVGGPFGGQSSRLRSARSWCGPAIVPSSDSTPVCWHLFLFTRVSWHVSQLPDTLPGSAYVVHFSARTFPASCLYLTKYRLARSLHWILRIRVCATCSYVLSFNLN